jgi:hypothetical protein
LTTTDRFGRGRGDDSTTTGAGGEGDVETAEVLIVDKFPTDTFDELTFAGVLVWWEAEVVDTFSPRLPVREDVERSTDLERRRLPVLLLLLRRMRPGLGPAALALLLLARCLYVRFRLL